MDTFQRGLNPETPLNMPMLLRLRLKVVLKFELELYMKSNRLGMKLKLECVVFYFESSLAFG